MQKPKVDPASKAEDEGPGGPCLVALVTGQVLVFGGVQAQA